MNLPNAITIARIALVPVFVVFAYTDTTAGAIGAFILFLVASLSDSLDGYLARRAQTITKTGEFLDPLADKLLVGAALVSLVGTRDFPLWAALVIAVREVVIQIFRIRVVSTGGRLPASHWAKTKTVLQICMVSWWLLPWDSINVVHWIWLGLAVVVTVLSGAEYVVKREKAGATVER